MKIPKSRSIKKASFYSMLSGSLVIVVINFLVLSVFVIILSYMLINSHEDNLSKVLINNFHEKQESIINMAGNLSDVMASTSSEKEKRTFLRKSVNNVKDIKGIFILDEDGIIKDASSGYEDFIGLDFSGKDYYRDLVKSKDKEYIISSGYVSYRTRKLTINVVTPIKKDDTLKGMVVILINPDILENKSLEGLEYYLVDKNGDIIFQNDGVNVISREDNIKDSIIMQHGLIKQKALFYNDRITGKFVLGSISKDPMTSMYVIVEYHIFGNAALFSGLIIMFAIAILIVIAFLFIFSAGVSDVITRYIEVFKNQVKKITAGNYDTKLSNRYPHEEINEIIDSFNDMAHKVKQREEELQAYNEELIAANDEINVMLTSLSLSEKERKDQYLQIIWTMVNLLEIKDEYTAGHSKAVTYYAEEIAEKLNKDYGFKINIESIQVAAILHDIGKIGIDKHILNKPSRLTKEEYEVIKTHPSKGYYALKDIKSLKEERKVIKYHHERYDGKGYPEGLKGDEIPLGARIIGVADAFDAMASDRPYRKGMPLEMAIGELVNNKGTQFDPLIAEVFISMLKEGQFGVNQGEAK